MTELSWLVGGIAVLGVGAWICDLPVPFVQRGIDRIVTALSGPDNVSPSEGRWR
jgi:hypothetical protein